MASCPNSSRTALFESRSTLSGADTCPQGELMQWRSGSHALLGAGWDHERVGEAADSAHRERSFCRHRIRRLIRIVGTSHGIPRSGIHLLVRGWKTGPRLNSTKEAGCAGAGGLAERSSHFRKDTRIPAALLCAASGLRLQALGNARPIPVRILLLQ